MPPSELIVEKEGDQNGSEDEEKCDFVCSVVPRPYLQLLSVLLAPIVILL